MAGHRRYAVRYPCRKCRQNAGQSAFDGRYRVDIRFGMRVKPDIALQFNENRHQQVPPHEEARMWKFYRWSKRNEREITISQFARKIGRTPEWVRGALRFCTLPSSVQNYADGTDGCVKLPYSILTSLARLGEGMFELTGEAFPESAYHSWIVRRVVGRLNATVFRKTVSEYLTSKQQEHRGQLSLFGLTEAYCR